MEQMAKYYWGMLTAAAGSSSPRSYWPPPAHATAAGEPSWEELAFARDAGHLGGCVWPPRSYTCTFCRREFRSAQALGGHMNVHRRDRARLRQCASPDHDDDAHKQESLIDVAPPADHHQLLQLQESPLFRAKAAAVPISGPKSTCCDHQIYSKAKDHHQEAVITTAATSSSYISSIVKESKLVISIPAATIDEEDDEVIVAAERRKRRRVHQKQPEALLPLFFLRPQLASSKSGVEHDAKVPKVITSPSSPNTLHSNLSGRQEVDLELRLALKK